MGNRRHGTGGKHEARTTRRKFSERQRAERRPTRVAATASALGVAVAAVAWATVIGIAPALSVSPQLLASLHYLRGTAPRASTGLCHGPAR